MKKLIQKTVIAALFLATAIPCSGQCPTTNHYLFVHYNTQTQIDEFPTKWPNCIDFEENFSISGDIINLEGLSQVKSFKKHFYLKNLSTLTDLTGLENLQSVGGILDFESNPSLQNLSSLSNLKTVGGNLEIGGCGSLKTLHGLEKLDSIGGSLSIGGCSGLKDLSGLEGLKTTGRLSLFHNENIQSLGGLDALTEVSYVINMTKMESLTDVSALKNLDRLGHGLTFWNCPMLADLSGVENLEQIGADSTATSGCCSMRIQECPSLKNLAAFKKLNYVNSMWIFRNQNLESLKGLDSLKTVRFGVNISDNPALGSLEALANLKTVNEVFRISNNDKLTSLHGTEGIDMANLMQLTLQKSDALTGCSQANICDYLKNGGVATIDSNLVGCNSVAEILAGCSVSTSNFWGEMSGFSVSPNPVLGGEPLQILFENDYFGQVKIELFTLDGRLATVVEKSCLSADREKTTPKQVFEIEKGLPGGSFFIRVLTEKSVGQKLILRF